MWGFTVNEVSRGCYLCLSSKPSAACAVLPTHSRGLVFLPGWCAGWSHGSQLWSVPPGPWVAGSVTELGSSPAITERCRLWQQWVTWQVARQGARAVLWPGSVPPNGSPLGAWSLCASLQRQLGAAPQRARQGTGHPRVRLLEPQLQTHIRYHVPCRASWCRPISLDLCRQAF